MKIINSFWIVTDQDGHEIQNRHKEQPVSLLSLVSTVV